MKSEGHLLLHGRAPHCSPLAATTARSATEVTAHRPWWPRPSLPLLSAVSSQWVSLQNHIPLWGITVITRPVNLSAHTILSPPWPEGQKRMDPVTVFSFPNFWVLSR